MSDDVRQSIFPALRYADANAAIEWLGEAFGAEPEQVHRGDDGSVQHAELRLGTNLVMVGEAREAGWLGGEEGEPLRSTISLYVVVADPDAHHDRAAAAGARIVRELDDMDYGSREYSARDLEGNLWSFGTYDPGGIPK
jgi:uncharacterized glyoxalase superfamily protein PhnB